MSVHTDKLCVDPVFSGEAFVHSQRIRCHPVVSDDEYARTLWELRRRGLLFGNTEETLEGPTTEIPDPRDDPAKVSKLKVAEELNKKKKTTGKESKTTQDILDEKLADAFGAIQGAQSFQEITSKLVQLALEQAGAQNQPIDPAQSSVKVFVMDEKGVMREKDIKKNKMTEELPKSRQRKGEGNGVRESSQEDMTPQRKWEQSVTPRPPPVEQKKESGAGKMTKSVIGSKEVELVEEEGDEDIPRFDEL